MIDEYIEIRWDIEKLKAIADEKGRAELLRILSLSFTPKMANHILTDVDGFDTDYKRNFGKLGKAFLRKGNDDIQKRPPSGDPALNPTR